MIYSEFQGKQLSLLGFGAMRLPMANNEIDVALVEKMVAYAMENGVNYFDTAYPYHGGMSERVMGKILGKYPRNSFYLADKFPGHQTLESYEPAPIFERAYPHGCSRPVTQGAAPAPDRQTVNPAHRPLRRGFPPRTSAWPLQRNYSCRKGRW